MPAHTLKYNILANDWPFCDEGNKLRVQLRVNMETPAAVTDSSLASGPINGTIDEWEIKDRDCGDDGCSATSVNFPLAGDCSEESSSECELAQLVFPSFGFDGQQELNVLTTIESGADEEAGEEGAG